MRILAIVNGEYGRRHVANVQTHAPASWLLTVWQAPAFFPPVIDYPKRNPNERRNQHQQKQQARRNQS